jgi:hypothetical protein
MRPSRLDGELAPFGHQDGGHLEGRAARARLRGDDAGERGQADGLPEQDGEPDARIGEFLSVGVVGETAPSGCFSVS